MKIAMSPIPVTSFAPAAAPMGTHHHKPVPAQPQLGSVRHERADGSTRSFAVRPYLHEPGDWATRYADVAAAVAAGRNESAYWGGLVTFGVVQAADGAFLIRPMESENGNAFTLDPEVVGAVRITATATAAGLVALVGGRTWVDFATSRTDVAPKPFGTATRSS